MGNSYIVSIVMKKLTNGDMVDMHIRMANIVALTGVNIDYNHSFVIDSLCMKSHNLFDPTIRIYRDESESEIRNLEDGLNDTNNDTQFIVY